LSRIILKKIKKNYLSYCQKHCGGKIITRAMREGKKDWRRSNNNDVVGL
jgi:hypothetical protein